MHKCNSLIASFILWLAYYSNSCCHIRYVLCAYIGKTMKIMIFIIHDKNVIYPQTLSILKLIKICSFLFLKSLLCVCVCMIFQFFSWHVSYLKYKLYKIIYYNIVSIYYFMVCIHYVHNSQFFAVCVLVDCNRYVYNNGW